MIGLRRQAMRAKEAEELKDEIWHAICKKGVPIDVRTGMNMDAADWFKKLMEKYINIDEPLGTIQGTDYEHCPVCNGIIGQSAYYCKHCGAYIRQRRD